MDNKKIIETDTSSIEDTAMGFKEGYFVMKKMGSSKIELQTFANKSIRGFYYNLFKNKHWKGNEKKALIYVLNAIDSTNIRNVYLKEANKILNEKPTSEFGNKIGATSQGIFMGGLLAVIAYFYLIVNIENLDKTEFRFTALVITISSFIWYLFMFHDLQNYLFK